MFISTVTCIKNFFCCKACRGDSADGGTQIMIQPNRRKQSLNTETDAALMGPAVSYTIPVWADFLTIYSTFQGIKNSHILFVS